MVFSSLSPHMVRKTSLRFVSPSFLGFSGPIGAHMHAHGIKIEEKRAFYGKSRHFLCCPIFFFLPCSLDFPRGWLFLKEKKISCLLFGSKCALCASSVRKNEYCCQKNMCHLQLEPFFSNYIYVKEHIAITEKT